MVSKLLIFMIFIPSAVSCGDWGRVVVPGAILENRAGVLDVTKQNKNFGRVFHASRRCGASPIVAVQFAEVASQSQFYRALAAIAAEESGFRPDAVGQAGEQGMFQVRSVVWGTVPDNPAFQTRQCEIILKSLHKESQGNWLITLRKYNGSGPAARAYAKRVYRRMRNV